MDYLQTVIMGFVQGLSEFLPISSSAHLVLVSAFYKMLNGVQLYQLADHSAQEVFLDIMLHLGTLFAVVIYFREKLWSITKSFFVSVKNKDFSSSDTKLGIYIIAGTFVTAIIGLLLNDFAESLVFMPHIVACLLIGTGLLLLFAEFISDKIKNKVSDISFLSAILISIAQGIAVFPGFSRSGLTIATGLLTKHSRKDAAEFSFLLSVPIIFGASMVYPFLKLDFSQLLGFDWGAIILGTIVSAISGYLCIRYFMMFLGKFSLRFFGYYCLTIGLVSLFIFRNLFFIS